MALGSWLLPFGPDGAQQLISAAFADPGRSRDVAGRQAGAGGALGGDQLADPRAAVALRPPCCDRGGVALGAAVLGGLGAVGVCGSPVRATLISSSSAPSSATQIGQLAGRRPQERSPIPWPRRTG
jgi:hypothetical protein